MYLGNFWTRELTVVLFSLSWPSGVVAGSMLGVLAVTDLEFEGGFQNIGKKLNNYRILLYDCLS